MSGRQLHDVVRLFLGIRQVNDINSFYDFIIYVVLRAPDNFPYEDYLAEDEQMTIQKTFGKLMHGVALV